MTPSMRWRSTYREQYERESRYVVLANAIELVALFCVIAGLLKVWGAGA